jgi:hypothetical protein
MKLKLKSRRIRPVEELWAMEEKFPAVCGPNPVAYAARYGLKLSKTYSAFLRHERENGNGARKAVTVRRKLVAA